MESFKKMENFRRSQIFKVIFREFILTKENPTTFQNSRNPKKSNFEPENRRKKIENS